MTSACVPLRTKSTSTTSTPRSCTLLGLDHDRLTFRLNGLDQKLTGVEECHVVKKILA
jgi:hypothetical protein